MICRHCGKESVAGAKCQECGAPLGEGAVLLDIGLPAVNLSRRVPAPCVVPRGGSASVRSGAARVSPASASLNLPASQAVPPPSSGASGPLPVIVYGEVKEETPAAAEQKTQQIDNAAAASIYGTVPDEKTEEVSVRSTRPLHASVAAVQRTSDEALGPRPSPLPFIGRYLLLFIPLLATQALLSHMFPAFYTVPMIAALIIGALALPVMRVTPFPDEDPDDLPIFIALCLLFGPLTGMLIYAVIGMLRQTVNPSLMGCFLIAASSRLTADLSIAHGSIAHILLYTMPFTPFSNGAEMSIGWPIVRTLLIDWLALTTLIGWYASTSLRRLDE